MALTQPTILNNAGFYVKRDPLATASDFELELLSDEQKGMVESALLGENILMHGPAGTGKSVTLKRLIYVLQRRHHRFAITAFTGSAAININGTTIHSFFKGLGLMKEDAETLFKKMKRKPDLMNKVIQLQTLVIDEISMVSSTFFDKIDKLFRLATKIDRPFGGKQIILSGDFYQLPPMEKAKDGAQFAFESKVWKEMQLKTIEMKSVFRQVQGEFIDILHKMRVGELDIGDMSTLCKRVNAKIGTNDIIPTSLFSTNANADSVNCEQLEKLPGLAVTFMAKCTVNPKPGISEHDTKELFRSSMDIRKYCPAPEELKLKVGAQVMLRRNLDLAGGLANGSRGFVVDFENMTQNPIVKFVNGKQRVIDPFEFEFDYVHGKIVVKQLPLMLAWAMTIHKSQGSSLDLVSISTHNMFVDGQAYVAFSRARTLEGLSLRDFDPRAVRVSEKVKAAFPVVLVKSVSPKKAPVLSPKKAVVSPKRVAPVEDAPSSLKRQKLRRSSRFVK